MINPRDVLLLFVGAIVVILLVSLIPMMVSLIRNKSTVPADTAADVALHYTDGNVIAIGDMVRSKETKFQSGSIELLFAADVRFYKKAAGRDALVTKSHVHVRTEDGELIAFQSPFSDLIFLRRQ